ncbi:MAG: hypothetical protein ACKV1O_25720 [Saprospiraceae bacterium]
MNNINLLGRAIKALALAGFCFLFSTNAGAQSADTTLYIAYAYMKVKPGKEAEYLKMEKAYKKLHTAAQKAGNLADWALARIVSPYGANCEYNYVASNVLRGSEQLARFYEGSPGGNWQSLLTKEEIALVNRTDEIRTLVKQEVWSVADGIFPADWKKGKVLVFNYFSSPADATRADHVKVEQDIWKPIHAARVKDGKMKAWILYEMEFPFGADMPYNMATADVYTDMKEYLAPWFNDYFKKVHPGKDMDQLIQQTQAVTTLRKGEVRMILDRLDWK